MGIIRNKATVTRNDVARACGVSGALVSYAFSDTAQNKVKPETREKILLAARKLGYRPSLIGRCLKNNCSYNVCILLPERFVSAMSLHQLRIFHGVCMAIQETEYRPMVFFGVNEKLFKTLEENRVDGIIVLDSANDLSYADKLLDYQIPLVFANVEYRSDSPLIASVRSNHEKLVRDRIADLVKNNCKNILQVSACGSLCQPNYILKQEFEKVQKQYAAENIRFHDMTFRQYDVTDDLRLKAETFFSGDTPCDGVLVDGGCFADMIVEAARRHGIKLERNRNCFVSCSQEANFPNWSHNSFRLGCQAWESMQNMLNGQKVEKLKLIPYFLAENEKDLEDNSRID